MEELYKKIRKFTEAKPRGNTPLFQELLKEIFDAHDAIATIEYKGDKKRIVRTLLMVHTLRADYEAGDYMIIGKYAELYGVLAI